MTKPAYVRFCNQIHLLDLQAKGDKDGEVARKAKQDLLMELAGIKTMNQAQGQPKQQKGRQARIWQAPPRIPTVVGPQTRRIPRQGKRRQCDVRIIPGETRIRKRHNKWQRLRLRRKQWDLLLNNKQDAESVAEGAAELHPITQRMIPAPRKRKGKRNLRVINGFSKL